MTTTLIANGELQPGAVRVVWKSPEIPGAPIAVRSNFAPAFIAKLRAEFAKFNVDYWVKEGECTAGDSSCGPDGGIYGWAAPVTDKLLRRRAQGLCDDQSPFVPEVLSGARRPVVTLDRVSKQFDRASGPGVGRGQPRGVAG